MASRKTPAPPAAAPSIAVKRQGAGLAFAVTVADARSGTRHRVTMREEDWARWRALCESPERCLEAAFTFLIDREPKEAILAGFDFSVIARYFPDFAEAFPAYLGRLRRGAE